MSKQASLNQRMRRLGMNALGGLLALLIAAGMLEGLLRIYNPVPSRVKGKAIILPSQRVYRFHNSSNSRLDAEIVHHKNSLGFRGPEMPADFEDSYTLIAVGGSTTECFFLSDGRDWPALLMQQLARRQPKVWVNNAGLDGHSTFGHQILLDDYLSKLRPDVVLYLVGANDVGRQDLSEYDKDKLLHAYSSFSNWLIKHSELAGLIGSLRRSLLAHRYELVHNPQDLRSLPQVEPDTLAIEAELQRQRPLVQAYEARLTRLVQRTRALGITPVLLTQPCLPGQGQDELTGVDLARIQYCGPSGLSYWRVLEAYNDATRRVARSQDLLLVDLAQLLPKSSRYFYDCLHFTNEGAEQVACLVMQALERAAESSCCIIPVQTPLVSP